MRAIARICSVIVPLGFAAAAFAQQASRDARIGYVYPAGGQQGSTFTVTVGGQNLDSISDVRITGSGVKATIVDHFKAINGGQATLLRDRLKELMDKRAAALRGEKSDEPSTRPVWTPEDDKTIAEIRKRLLTFIRKPSSPAIAENVTLEITLSPDAQPGDRELRLITTTKMTNPMVFRVGTLPEFSEKPAKPVGEAARSVPKDEMTITLPAVVNGQILPGGVDRYRFKASKDQHLVVAASARDLIPYIADAVPGWFQATVTLYGPNGREVAYNDDYRYRPDPAFEYTIPEDGEYAMEVRDAIYRGREDFVYRITLGDVPVITDAFPLGGRFGAEIPVELRGWNLPANTTTMNTRGKQAGVYPLPLAGQSSIDPATFQVDTLPEISEREPNHQVSAAQAIELPTVINGRIAKPGEVDVFRIDGKAGQTVVAEINARRLGSPLDSAIEVTDSTGKQVAFNDDHDDKASGLDTHHADSYLMTKLPADGVYYVSVRDTQGEGAPEFAYRLRISPPRPDFELRVVPSSVTLRRWANEPITIYALRKDGFAGDIRVAFLPPFAGLKLADPRIPGDKQSVQVKVTVPQVQPDGIFAVRLQGRATIAGREVVKPAIPADDMMQAFAYRHLVPAQELVAVIGRPPLKAAIEEAPIRDLLGPFSRAPQPKQQNPKP